MGQGLACPLAGCNSLATVDISEPAEEELSDEGADGGSNLDAEVLVGGEGAVVVCESQVSGEF
jgi:hypothetical protein